jgi:hypothetical protein
MKSYKITTYTKKRAQKLGVKVLTSKNVRKKIDVYDFRGNLLASIGARGMGDFPTWLEKRGKKYAHERRRLYKIRHWHDRKVKYSPGWYADQLLW